MDYHRILMISERLHGAGLSVTAYEGRHRMATPRTTPARRPTDGVPPVHDASVITRNNGTYQIKVVVHRICSLSPVPSCQERWATGSACGPPCPPGLQHTLCDSWRHHTLCIHLSECLHSGERGRRCSVERDEHGATSRLQSTADIEPPGRS